MKQKTKTLLTSIISVMLAVIMVAGIAPLSVFAEETVSIDLLTFELNEEETEYSITACDKSASGSLVIPSTYNSLPVTSIGGGALDGCSHLTSVTIPNSVTRIEFLAFRGCTSLVSVDISASVVEIGNLPEKTINNISAPMKKEWKLALENSMFSVFGGCTNLEAINVDIENVKFSSEDGVLFNKEKTILIQYPIGKKQTQYDIPNGVVSISSTIYPEDVTEEIKEYITISVSSFICGTFENNKNLKRVSIPESVTTIGNSSFKGCTGLTNIILPYGVTTINSYTFRGCTGLTNITLNNGLTTIGNSSFEGCTGLTSITVPDSVMTIADSAFKGCTGLTDVTIGDGVNFIDNYAFQDCVALKSITIPENVSALGNKAWGEEDAYTVFQGCTNFENISVESGNNNFSSKDGVLFNKDKTTLLLYPRAKKADSYTIPDGVTTIVNDAFRDCNNLKTITIPSSVTEFSCYSLGLEEIIVLPGNERYLSIDGVLIGLIEEYDNETDNYYYTSSYEIACYPKGNTRTSYTIPDIVTSIGYATFYGCNNLKSIIISDNISEICDSALKGCSNLTSVTIPESVTSIGNCSFTDCISLTDVYYAGSEEDWNKITIDDGNDPLLNATIHYNWTGEMPHVHTLQTIENPATCTVNGIRYQQCINCGEQIGEATIIPALGHSWGEWKEITPATTEAEGVEERACSVCGEKETRAIPRLAQTVKDESSGIEISAPSDAYEGTLELEIEEIFDGESYNVVSTIDGAAQNKVYDITTKVDGEPAQPGKAVTVRIPLPEGYDPDRTYVYHVNSETGEVENMNARYEDGCLVFETDHFSVYAVVEMEEERSFFGKVVDVLLGIVSLPVKLIVGLFKLIIGLFK